MRLTPTTISMARAASAEYMADFAELLGHQEHVHFEGGESGQFVPGIASGTHRAEQGAAARR